MITRSKLIFSFKTYIFATFLKYFSLMIPPTITTPQYRNSMNEMILSPPNTPNVPPGDQFKLTLGKIESAVDLPKLPIKSGNVTLLLRTIFCAFGLEMAMVRRAKSSLKMCLQDFFLLANLHCMRPSSFFLQSELMPRPFWKFEILAHFKNREILKSLKFEF